MDTTADFVPSLPPFADLSNQAAACADARRSGADRIKHPHPVRHGAMAINPVAQRLTKRLIGRALRRLERAEKDRETAPLGDGRPIRVTGNHLTVVRELLWRFGYLPGKGKMYPSLATLARVTGKAVGTVVRALALARYFGVVAWLNRRLAESDAVLPATNSYLLCPDTQHRAKSDASPPPPPPPVPADVTLRQVRLLRERRPAETLKAPTNQDRIELPDSLETDLDRRPHGVKAVKNWSEQVQESLFLWSEKTSTATNIGAIRSACDRALRRLNQVRDHPYRLPPILMSRWPTPISFTTATLDTQWRLVKARQVAPHAAARPDAPLPPAGEPQRRFAVGDRVRLTRRIRDLPTGAIGVVAVADDERYEVDFDDPEMTELIEAEDLEP